MDAREERGLVIAATSRIEKTPVGWKVPSQSGNGTYVVNLDHEHPFCTCPDFEKGNICKHIHAVEFVVKRETKPDGTVTETRTAKITYGQGWTAYNDAQQEEKRRFVELLANLCSKLSQPEQATGRQRADLDFHYPIWFLHLYSRSIRDFLVVDSRQTWTRHQQSV